jgi:hypothetical protein
MALGRYTSTVRHRTQCRKTRAVQKVVGCKGAPLSHTHLQPQLRSHWHKKGWKQGKSQTNTRLERASKQQLPHRHKSFMERRVG